MQAQLTEVHRGAITPILRHGEDERANLEGWGSTHGVGTLKA